MSVQIVLTRQTESNGSQVYVSQEPAEDFLSKLVQKAMFPFRAEPNESVSEICSGVGIPQWQPYRRGIEKFLRRQRIWICRQGTELSVQLGRA